MTKNIAKLLFVLTAASSCTNSGEKYHHHEITEPPGAQQRAAEIRANTSITLADGLEMTLWASDSLAPDPVAMSVDDYGAVYLTRTNRQKDSEFDIRGHVDWMTASISLKSVEDRRAFLKSTFATEKSTQNNWLKDLNGDGVHDWRDLAVQKDEVWKLKDTDSDGVADISTRIIEDFAEEVADVAGALLVRRNDMFIGIGPDMWRFTDTNGDGHYDARVSISHGYAVHIGFGGHGMSGAIEGPDGKIYWGIGDIGANITAADGTHYNYPNQGILVRSNPDGSDFEVFAAGLRNVHEFAFDEYGNIIGGDNDGDYPGESERLVHIIEGSDAGWRSNWQYGKYTDPHNNRYNVWIDERLFVPRWQGQASYILPPIQNFHNGPTGMVYNPGTALGKKWQKHFFLVEFTGTPARSPIWAFTLEPKGASFVLKNEVKAALGVLPTGIRFGPDGALYAADWINGWSTKNYGRVWRLDVTDDQNDLASERAETLRLMTLDYTQPTNEALYQLLMYPDMRIRQKTQFELATRRESQVLLNAANQKENQLARVHGIWGLGQVIRTGDIESSLLYPFLEDADPEIVTQTIKVLGEIRDREVETSIRQLLHHPSDRVVLHATTALGRIGNPESAPAIVEMLEENNDTDQYLRHAGVWALANTGNPDVIYAMQQHTSEAIRMAGVLTLRKLGDPRIADYLEDPSLLIVREAARGINDDWSIAPALPKLALMLNKSSLRDEIILRRAINAASRVGSDQMIDLLLNFSQRNDIAEHLRAEAITVVGIWGSPSPLDRVDGRNRDLGPRDDSYARTNFSEIAEELLRDQHPIMITATSRAIVELNSTAFVDQQAMLATTHQSEHVRASMVTDLFDLKYEEIALVVQKAMQDDAALVRASGIAYVDALNLDKEQLQELAYPIFEKGTLQEQQKLLKVMGNMPMGQTETLMLTLTSDYNAGKLNPGIALDLAAAVDSTKSATLIAKIADTRPSGTSAEDFADVLYGGNVGRGNGLFWGHPAAQCVRCHSLGTESGGVGPSLGNIGNVLTREQLVEALIEPSARLAPNFGNVTLTLTDGSTVSGLLLEETADEVRLQSVNAEPLRIPLARISERQNSPSAMPPMGNILTRHELRDLVEFLSGLKAE